MHSQVKNTVHPEMQLVSALAKHLLSPSRFENGVLLSQTAARDGLRCLAALDKPTQLSLPVVPEITTAPQVPSGAEALTAPSVSPQVASPAPRETPTLSSRFGSQKP